MKCLLLCFSVAVATLFAALAPVEAQQSMFSAIICPLDDEDDDKPRETIDPDCIIEAQKRLKKENLLLKNEIEQLKKELIEQNSTRMEEIGELNEKIKELIITSGSGDKGNSTDVWQAADSGDLPAVVFYINQDPTNLDKQNINSNDKTPLLHAVYRDHLDVAEFLIRRGADVNALNRAKGPSLIIASFWGYAEIVELLIKKGADLNIQDVHQRTALHYAIRGNRLEAAKLLVENGADQDLKNDEGKTALDDAKHRRLKSIVKLLLRNN